VKNFKRPLYILAAFGLTLGALAAAFSQSQLFEISRIPVEVVGDNTQAESVIAPDLRERLLHRLASRNSAIQGHKIWDVDISGLKSLLQSDEWVGGVRISRVLPNTVKVTVQPKQPMALFVRDHSSMMKVISSDASLLPVPGVNLALDLPIVRGEELFEQPAVRQKLVEFMEKLPPTGLLSRSNIAEISYAKEDGYTLFLMNTKSEVKLGDARIETKIARVSQVLDYLAANNLKGRVIDASFPKKVLVRLRKDP